MFLVENMEKEYFRLINDTRNIKKPPTVALPSVKKFDDRPKDPSALVKISLS